MDFRDAPINQILDFFSVTSGLTVIKDPGLQGTATLISPRPIPLSDAINVLEALLDIRGYRLDQTDTMIRIVPKSGGGNRDSRPGSDNRRAEMAANLRQPKEQTKVYRLEYASAKSLSSIVNDLFKNVPGDRNNRVQNNGKNTAPNNAAVPPPPARASSDDYSNSVVVTGPPDQLSQVDQIVKQIDNPVGSSQVTQIYPVEYVAVQDLSSVVSGVLLASQNGGAESGAASNVPFNQRARALARGGSTIATNGQVVPHLETNSLIVTAPKESQDLIRQVIGELDQPQEVKSTSFVRNLQNVSASDVAQLLSQMYGQRAGSRGGYYNGGRGGGNYNPQRSNNNRNGRTASFGGNNRGRRG
jgi:type II secretory pathway component GspD/PulD (secretin)